MNTSAPNILAKSAPDPSRNMFTDGSTIAMIGTCGQVVLRRGTVVWKGVGTEENRPR